MADAGHTRPIIVRKTVKRSADGHHGGAWKVAYADFVTAMMAFFLLMWLLNATTEKQRRGLADYFDPAIPVSATSGGGAGVLQGDSFLVEGVKAGSRDEGVRPGAPVPEREGEASESVPGPAGELPAAPSPAASSAQTDGTETDAAFEALAEQVRDAMDAAGEAVRRHFLLHVTPEGLVIEIVDASDAPLFASGSAEAEQRLRGLIGVIAPVLGMTVNPLKVVGHTDSRPFGRPGSDNWRLSTARANTARVLMEQAGLARGRFAEVAGRAATEPLVADPEAPQNRRIALTLLRTPAR